MLIAATAETTDQPDMGGTSPLMVAAASNNPKGQLQALCEDEYRGEQVMVQKQLHPLCVLRLVPMKPALGDQIPQTVGQMGVLLGLERRRQLLRVHGAQGREKLVAPALRIAAPNLEEASSSSTRSSFWWPRIEDRKSVV